MHWPVKCIQSFGDRVCVTLALGPVAGGREVSSGLRPQRHQAEHVPGKARAVAVPPHTTGPVNPGLANRNDKSNRRMCISE